MLQYGMFTIEEQTVKQFDEYARINIEDFKKNYVDQNEPIKIEQIFIGYSEKYGNDYMSICFSGINEEKLILQTSSKYFMNSIYKNIITPRGFINEHRASKVYFRRMKGNYNGKDFEYLTIK